MKTTTRRVPTRFAPEARFESKPTTVSARRAVDSELERLRKRMLRQVLFDASDLAEVPALRRAANDAASLAWLTAYPLLTFPTLFEEKVAEARRQALCQAHILERSPEILLEAA